MDAFDQPVDFLDRLLERCVVTFALPDKSGQEDAIELAFLHLREVYAVFLTVGDVETCPFEPEWCVCMGVDRGETLVHLFSLMENTCLLHPEAEDFDHGSVACFGHSLRMPLDGHDCLVREGVVGLNNAIRRVSGRLEDRRQVFYSLMVVRVHADFGFAEDLGQGALGIDRDRMRGELSGQLLYVLDVAFPLRGNILIKRSAKRDVDQLLAPADTEKRDVAVRRQLDQFQLELIACGVDLFQCLSWLLAIPKRVYVRTASDNNRIEVGYDITKHLAIGCRGNDNR